MKTITVHHTARMIAACCHDRGIRQLIISPGSRSAPLLLAFEEFTDIKKTVLPDERSAAYTAMGMALSLGKPVAVLTTSGTATLNAAPALCEAFYLGVPLVMITADRPDHLYFSGENQTIVQQGIYSSFVAGEFHVSTNPVNIKKTITNITGLLDLCIRCQRPIHFNVALKEPLYQTQPSADHLYIPKTKPHSIKTTASLKQLEQAISSYSRVLWFDGMNYSSPNGKNNTNSLSQSASFIRLHEPLANKGEPIVIPVEESFYILLRQFQPDMHPDLLITREGQILSKKFRQYFTQYPPKHHIHISRQKEHWYRFDCKYTHILIPRDEIQSYILSNSGDSACTDQWQKLGKEILAYRKKFLANSPWSEWKAIQLLAKMIPKKSVVHLGNSGVVRYASLTEWPKTAQLHANRGTSGIDGTLSTACGASSVSPKPHICILGDVSFHYDLNALWRESLPDNLKIIVIQNGGGNIFRMIPGPSDSGLLDKYFLTHFPFSIQKLAKSHNLAYFRCSTEKEWQNWLNDKLNKPGCCLVELRIDGEKSAAILSKYYQHLNLAP